MSETENETTEPAAEAETPAPAAEEPATTEAEEVEAPETGAEAAGEAEEGEPGDTPAAEAEAAPAAPEKKQRPRKHVPRTERRKRTKPPREKPADRKPIVRLPKPEAERGRRQERRGVVVSSAMDKTIVVKVDVIKMHPRYKKVIRRSQKFHAHDERNQANVGDMVRIVETRPLSKTKHWRLAEVVEVAK
jgi:small subunit ribosomal protein S17